MSKSNLNKYQDELLEILVEECAELIQEKSKVFRFGINAESHHRVGESHLACLTQELGDILAMIQLITESGIGITEEALSQAMEAKLEKVKIWMTNKKPNLPVYKEKVATKEIKAKKKSTRRELPGKNARAILPLLEEIAERDEVIASFEGAADAMAKTLALAQSQLDNYKKEE